MDIIPCSEWQFSFSKTVGETSQDCKDRPLISFHYSWIFPPGSGPLTSSSQLMLPPTPLSILICLYSPTTTPGTQVLPLTSKTHTSISPFSSSEIQ